MGREQVAADPRLDRARSQARPSDDRGLRRAVREGEGHHAAHQTRGGPLGSLLSLPGAPSPESAPAPRPAPVPGSGLSRPPRAPGRAIFHSVRRVNDQSHPLLRVNNVEVVYDHVILVLKGVSLQVPAGGIVSLLGATGAG